MNEIDELSKLDFLDLIILHFDVSLEIFYRSLIPLACIYLYVIIIYTIYSCYKRYKNKGVK
jgi:hypothetical protein